MANGHGGTRPGAGRKRKTVTHARPIVAAEKRIADHLPELIDSLLALAMGVLIRETNDDGTVECYLEPPDRAACVYLCDRVMGRPTERHELTGRNGKPLVAAEAQRRMLADPKALALACELDALLASPGPDSGGVGAPGEPRGVGLPASPGAAQS